MPSKYQKIEVAKFVTCRSCGKTFQEATILKHLFHYKKKTKMQEPLFCIRAGAEAKQK